MPCMLTWKDVVVIVSFFVACCFVAWDCNHRPTRNCPFCGKSVTLTP